MKCARVGRFCERFGSSAEEGELFPQKKGKILCRRKGGHEVEFGNTQVRILIAHQPVRSLAHTLKLSRKAAVRAMFHESTISEIGYLLEEGRILTKVSSH
jgi:hypothetical protein